MRLLERVKIYFLRQYDVRHSSLVIQHMAFLAKGRDEAERILTRHSARNYGTGLGLLALPFLGAAFAYERAPLLWDALASAEVASPRPWCSGIDRPVRLAQGSRSSRGRAAHRSGIIGATCRSS
jgi:hypothetical protein